MALAIDDLITIIFENILKIDPTLLSKYVSVEDQIIFLIFIPHIVLFLFIFGFMRVMAPGHKGLQYLVAIASYVYLLSQGIYGKILIPLFNTYLTVSIFLGLGFFVLSRLFFHPAQASEVASVARAAASKLTERGKKEKHLEAEIRSLTRQIDNIEATYPIATRPREVAALHAQLIAKRSQKEQELSDL